jgi:hypothetical protein
MTALRPRRLIAPLAFASVTAILGGILYAELAGSVTPPPQSTVVVPAETVRIEGGERWNVPPLEKYSAIAERPLFRATRRRADPAATAEPDPDRTFDAKLIGILILEADRVAWFRTGAGGEIVALREGERIQGWLVRAIGVDRVVVVGDQTQELRLFGETTSAETPPVERATTPSTRRLRAPGAVARRPPAVTDPPNDAARR